MKFNLFNVILVALVSLASQSAFADGTMDEYLQSNPTAKFIFDSSASKLDFSHIFPEYSIMLRNEYTGDLKTEFLRPNGNQEKVSGSDVDKLVEFMKAHPGSSFSIGKTLEGKIRIGVGQIPYDEKPGSYLSKVELTRFASLNDGEFVEADTFEDAVEIVLDPSYPYKKSRDQILNPNTKELVETIAQHAGTLGAHASDFVIGQAVAECDVSPDHRDFNRAFLLRIAHSYGKYCGAIISNREKKELVGTIASPDYQVGSTSSSVAK
jgi:hypothetical protein